MLRLTTLDGVALGIAFEDPVAEHTAIYSYKLSKSYSAESGLPVRIRSKNGVLFCCTHSAA